MIGNCIKLAVSSIENVVNRERFENNGSSSSIMPQSSMNQNGVGGFLVVFIAFLIIVLLISLIGQFLWNFAVAGEEGGLFPFVKKAKSIWHILALYILLSLFFSGSN
tara:strand:- start:203 stop:523 length:321 start_codon:yes stop_codon:yes gene_type:complete